MQSYLRKFLTPPEYIHTNESRKARIIHILVLSILFVEIFYCLAILIFDSDPIIRLIYNIVIIVITLLLLHLNRRYIQLTTYLLIFLTWLSVAIATLLLGGVRSASFTSFAIVILITGLLLGSRAAIGATVITIITALFIYFVELNGLIQENPFGLTQENALFGQIANFVLIALLFYLAVTDLNKALDSAKKSEQELSEAINESSILLTTALDLEQVLNSILGLLARVVNYDSATIFLIQNHKLQVVAGQGHPKPEQVIGQTFAYNSGVFKEIATTKRPLFIKNVQEDQRFVHWTDENYFRGWMGVPLIANDDLLGFLTVDSKQIGTYDKKDTEITVRFANQAAIAILNAQLFRETQQRLEEQKALRAAISAMTESLDLSIVLQQIATQLCKAIDATSAYICSYEAKEMTSTILAEYFSPAASELERISDLGTIYSIPDEFPNPITVVKTHQPIINHINQPSLELPIRHHMEASGAKSTLLLPLIYQDEVIAFAELWESRNIRQFSNEEITLCQDIAHQATITIINAQLFEATQQQLTAQIALRNASQSIIEPLDLDTILTQIAEQFCKIIDGTSAYINLVDATTETMRVEAEYFSEYANEQEKNSDLGVTYAFHEQSITYDPNNHKPMCTHIDDQTQPFGAAHLQEYGAQSRLILPVHFQDQLLAFAEVWESRRHREFTEDEIALCENIANQAAVAIRNSQLLSESNRRLREQTALRQAITAMTKSLDLPVVLDQIVKQLVNAIDVTSAYICSFDPERLTILTLANHFGEAASELERLSDTGTEYYLPDDSPELEKILVAGTPNIRHVDNETINEADKAHFEKYGAKSVLTIPMVYHDEPIAFVALWEGRYKRPFTEDEIALCNDIAQQATSALINARLYKRVQNQANILENEVQARTAELIAANEQLQTYTKDLEQSNRELEAFAYVASHDLQEPLRKIQTFSDHLGKRYASQLDARGQDYLMRMNTAAFRMQSLIIDLLTYSRIATRTQSFSAINLNAILNDVVSDLSVQIKENKAIISEGDLPKIEADAPQIRQLFQNLISNSLKFQQPNTPPIIKIYSKPALENDQLPDPHHVHIIFEDNGIGFDEKYMPRIFEVFQRLHSRSQFQGTGVGLAICRKIVLRHQGTITAQSQPNQGTKFIVTLPKTQNKKAPQTI